MFDAAKRPLLLAALLPLLLGMDFMDSPGLSTAEPPHRGEDSQALRDAVDESQTLVDALARETVHQDRNVIRDLAHDLRMEYKLPQAEDRARRCIELGEEILRIQGGIKSLQEGLKTADEAGTQAIQTKLLGLQSDLMGQVEELRRVLRSLHKDLKEEQVRDLRNWMMVSQGLLQRRREAAEDAAKRQAAAEALPIDAGTVQPPPQDKAKP
jgi:hypothetical protein